MNDAEQILWDLARGAVLALAKFLGSTDRAKATINAWLDAADLAADAAEDAKFGPPDA